MTNQEILNKLAEIEEALFYKEVGGADREGISFKDLSSMHDKIRDALNEWYRLTGCTLQ